MLKNFKSSVMNKACIKNMLRFGPKQGLLFIYLLILFHEYLIRIINFSNKITAINVYPEYETMNSQKLY